jgi:hypothetical protein
MEAERIDKVVGGIQEMIFRASWDDIDRQRDRFQPVLNDSLSVIRELKAENDRLKQEKADVVKRIEEEIELNPAYEPDCGYDSEIVAYNYQLGYQEGLHFTLDILKPSICTFMLPITQVNVFRCMKKI